MRPRTCRHDLLTPYARPTLGTEPGLVDGCVAVLEERWREPCSVRRAAGHFLAIFVAEGGHLQLLGADLGTYLPYLPTKTSSQTGFQLFK